MYLDLVPGTTVGLPIPAMMLLALFPEIVRGGHITDINAKIIILKMLKCFKFPKKRHTV